MRFIILLLLLIWHDSYSFGHIHANIHENIHFMSKRTNRFSKRQDDMGYLEQCSILQFWDKQIGRVNVLAFFDSSWKYSHRQASMLKVLKERFEKTGFDNIQFFAINAAPGEGQFVDRLEVEIEEETWRKISPTEAGGSPPVVVSSEALVEALGPDVYFIQDTDQLQIWYKLRAYRDQILVIDRCGRLTYQVIVPWSILHFPYVKAAILSTYKDEPCGYCQFKESPFGARMTESVYSSETSTINDVNENSTTITSEKPEAATVSYNDAIPEESTTMFIESEKLLLNQEIFDPKKLSATVKNLTETSTSNNTTEKPATKLNFETEAGDSEEPVSLENQTEAFNGTSLEDESSTMNTEPDTDNVTSAENESSTMNSLNETDSATSAEDELTTLNAEAESIITSQEDELSTLNPESETDNIPSTEDELTTLDTETEPSNTNSTEDELSSLGPEYKNDNTPSSEDELLPLDDETEPSNTTSTEDELTTLDDDIEPSIAASKEDVEPSTLSNPNETDHAFSTEDELSTLSYQNETGNTTSTEDNVSALNAQTGFSNITSLEEELTILDDQTESNNVTSVEKELPIDSAFDDASTVLNEPSENFDMAFSSDEALLLLDRMKNSTFVTSPSEFDTSTDLDLNGNFFNSTSNEDWDRKISNVTDFESSSEVTEEVTDKAYLDKTAKEFSDTTDYPFTDNFTDRPYTDNFTEDVPGATTDITNSRESEASEPRLIDTGEIENIDSRDVLKSRLTNARSVSANDGTKNKLVNEEEKPNGEASQEQTSTEPDFKIPIRIIMRAPHVDEYSDRSMKSHEYLVLKTGEPDYHEHLDSRETNASQIVTNEASAGNKTETIKKRIFGKDESPGLYGEVADYWRSLTNTDDDDEDEQVLEQEETFSEDTISKSTILTDKIDVETESESPGKVAAEIVDEKVNDYNNEEMDLVDEEAKSKLIAHYSKLLPWLYYVLAK